ncbi:hypothetical protein E2562_031265 [Oryza meyeriana var. granulata]|uniref:Uncharacterized protein n=1 Tax=Oryza meyeriana var. granulata TaxID=110450 RepID=A0A6G1FEC8_9ORYZ|nr:hypothetical protein E2562_031265 [Oryza meyeriana var. granulata]
MRAYLFPPFVPRAFSPTYTVIDRTSIVTHRPPMASVFWGGGHPADEVADFDEYDPTPYGGGYDLALTFGRALPPTDETCYPISTASSSCDRPQYGRRPPAEEAYGSAGHGRRPDDERHDGYGGGYGRKGRVDDDDEEATHGGYRNSRPTYGDDQPKYHGGRGGDERHTYGGGRKKYGDDDDGSGDERKPRYEKHDDDDEDDGYERKPRYKKHDDDDDSDGERKPRYEKKNRRRHDYDD